MYSSLFIFLLSSPHLFVYDEYLPILVLFVRLRVGKRFLENERDEKKIRRRVCVALCIIFRVFLADVCHYTRIGTRTCQPRAPLSWVGKFFPFILITILHRCLRTTLVHLTEFTSDNLNTDNLFVNFSHLSRGSTSLEIL